ncbi:SDR family oxidoreductase [Thalassospira lucentensis]|uniref:SDR family oxidoreductase n=1 Tax=Thalassospira lucentensis TaxID=168935 RepID=UPI0003B4ACA1|nr:SDR family oxidoreductase [Thalassospira lucentensis]RCK30803.1 hypothetical protein TH1_02495 [Thalassospira lucentensis MCCC 1A00383 = DSM 14000]
MNKKVYVLGGYGLIGSACIHRLVSAGFDVTGVGRSLEKGRRSNDQVKWHAVDIGTASAAEWKERLRDADIIVNAAGALQDGARDDLNAIHVNSIENITQALAGTAVTFIQVSAAGASEQASTEFMRSKARGDNVLMNSQLNWHVLRPTLVISRDAYGGTALLRAAAAFPLVNIQIFPDAQIQTVSIDDLTRAITKAATGLLPQNTIADITEEESQGFDELKMEFRSWLGLKPWCVTLPAPSWSIKLIGLIADMFGQLGWRSPLRTTALETLKSGICGNAQTWKMTGNQNCRSMKETMASMPATIQERWFAKLYLGLPLAITVLAIFWLASGIIGIVSFPTAQDVLTKRGISDDLAQLLILSGIIADITLGAAVLVRKLSRLACIGMITISAAYIIASLLTAPDLWLDPLGPMIKVIPSIVLTVFTISILEER